MRISDWSSDVCSSDLLHIIAAVRDEAVRDRRIDLDRPLRRRSRLEHVGKLDLPLQFGRFGVDELDRVRAGELTLGDARYGDDDSVAGLGEGGRRGERGQSERKRTRLHYST